MVAAIFYVTELGQTVRLLELKVFKVEISLYFLEQVYSIFDCRTVVNSKLDEFDCFVLRIKQPISELGVILRVGSASLEAVALQQRFNLPHPEAGVLPGLENRTGIKISQAVHAAYGLVELRNHV